ncbi:MAG: hypothetical protein AAF789_07080, partial [Bacteroidota bacterium]
MESNSASWYSFDWFSPGRLQSFDWEQPYWLYCLFLVPIIFLLKWLISYFFGAKLPIALTKKDIKSDPISYLRLIPPILFALSLGL